jgi:hypothetical protein
MNVRWHAALLVVMLAIAAGCSRSDAINICSYAGQTDCKTAAELNKEIAAEDAKQRRAAEALPFDYRDIVHALLVNYLPRSPFPDVEYRYYVFVFGGDVDVPLAARLHWSGFDVLPGSQWTLTDSRRENGYHISRIRIDVYDIEKVDRDTYTIGIGYYCGDLCASDSTYTLHRDGNGWHVVDRQMHWIS